MFNIVDNKTPERAEIDIKSPFRIPNYRASFYRPISNRKSNFFDYSDGELSPSFLQRSGKSPSLLLSSKNKGNYLNEPKDVKENPNSWK